MTLANRISRDAVALEDPVPFLPLVEKQARRLLRRLPAHVELGDLVSAGVLGLMEAVRRYNPDRSVAFHSYASFRIRGAMLDELRRRDLMARDARRESKAVESALHQLRLRLGRSPENFELADALGLDVAALEQRLEKLPHVSITSIDEQGGHEPMEPSLGAFEQVARRQLRGRLVAALGRLPERSQQVLELYYRENLTLKQIGEVLEVSESRVSQIMSKATLDLRGMLNETPAKEQHHE
jgi:RNA polymerase sigma factor for flagellar operon FliA